MTEANKARLRFLDNAKGLGMMMIVWMHIWGNNTFGFPPQFVNSYITSIYVPLFFVLSGYLIRVGNISLKRDMAKKAKSILRPFAVVYLFSFMVSYLLSFAGIGVKHSFEWRNILNPLYSKTFFNGPIWFLLALFWAFAFFYTIVKISRGKTPYIIIGALALGGIGFYLSRWGVTLPLFMGQGFVACPMLMMGWAIKKYIGAQIVELRWKTFLFLCAGLLLYVCFRTGVSMQENSYGGYYLPFLIGVFGGAAAILGFSILLEKCLPFAEYWGKYSLVVLCLHNYVLIPCTKITGKCVHHSLLWALVTFAIVYLCFLVIIPLISRYIPSLFNIKR